MSISGSQLLILHEGGLTMDEIIEVARGMERGPNLRAVSVLINTMTEQQFPNTAIAKCALACARDIIEQDRIQSERFAARIALGVDVKDTNRARRAMSDAKWRALRQEVFERDGHACQYCGDGADLTCDHVTPLARGGSNDPENLTTACRSCNSSKGDKLFPGEWNGRDVFQ